MNKSDKKIISQQEPISLPLIREVMKSDDCVEALRNICKPYTRTESLRPLDPKRIHACIDDRAYPFRLHAIDVSQDADNIRRAKAFFMGNTPLDLERITNESLLHRRSLAPAAWPAGDIGIAMQVAIGKLNSGKMQQQPYWDISDPSRFVDMVLADVMSATAPISDAYETSVHIDNHHDLPLICVDDIHGWRVHVENLQKCLSAGTGCGAAKQFTQIVCGMTSLLGNEEMAQAFATRMGGKVRGDVVEIPEETAVHVSQQLVYDAARRGKEVLVYVGPHHASKTVMTTGKITIDRSMMRISDPVYAGFKTDLMLNQPDAVQWQIIEQVNNQFNGALGDPLSYLIGVNLLTYHLLGQSNVPRYIL